MSDDPGFRFEGELGRGGMSVVHRAFDPVLERYTAVKVLSADRNLAAARARFLEEARVTARLDHPNIVPIYQFGTDPDGRDYINLKLVQGENLLDRIRQQGEDRLRPAQLTENLQVLSKACDAVAYAHARGVIHRDLKPSNVMIGEFGEVYVMDWGIALVQTDARGERIVRPEPESFDERGVLGTPTFVAPEQIEDPDGVDARADVYCLGGILYALLTGRAPHQGRTPMLRLLASSNGRIAPPDEVVPDGRLPHALVRLANHALQRDPRDRPQTVAAFRAELAAFLHGGWQLPIRRFVAGEVIVAEGEVGREAFVVRTGRCRVERAGEVIRELGPGDVFGELALLSTRGTRTSSVVAAEPVELMVVTASVLHEGLGLQSWVGLFVRALADRFRELEVGERPPPTDHG